MNAEMKRGVDRIRKPGMAVGLVALVAAAAWGFVAPQAFFEAWLCNWLFFLGLALGSLFTVMLHEVTGGEWGVALRPPLAAAMATLPLLFALAVPLAFGLPHLFAWAHAGAPAAPNLDAQRWYLNGVGFVVREAVFLVAWASLALALRGSLARAGGGKQAYRRALSIGGIVLYFVTITAAAVDWIASLVPQFSSTAIGVRLGATQALGGFAFAVACIAVAGRAFGQGAAPSARLCRDFGNLLLTMAIFLGYVAYMQYLIVWSADLPREVAWYLPRMQTSWRWVTLAIVVAELLVPIVAMLFTPIKTKLRALAAVCAIVLIGQWLDTFWLVVPSLRREGIVFHGLDFVVLLAFAGLWLAAFATALMRAPAMPRAAEAAEVALHG